MPGHEGFHQPVAVETMKAHEIDVCDERDCKCEEHCSADRQESEYFPTTSIVVV